MARARPRLPAIALALLLLAALALALALAGALPGSGGTPRASAQPSGEPVPQADASVPARSVTMIGATPEEAGAPGPGETWGIGRDGPRHVLVRYTSATGWLLGPALPADFTPLESPLVGEMTAHGAGVLAGTVSESGGTRAAVLVRGAGAAFAETARVRTQGETLAEGEEPLLGEHEELFAGHRAPLIASLEEEGGAPGALVVPVGVSGDSVEKQVLHWTGTEWQKEPIDVPAASEESFRVIAIAASSPGNAWLLARLASGGAYPAGAVALFKRVQEGEGWAWKPVALSPGSGDGEAHPLTLQTSEGEKPFTVANAGEPPTVSAQLLTITSAGVWVDGERADVQERTPDSATLFFRPGGSAGGQIEGSWCLAPGEGATCQYELPKPLPTGSGRSFAWADGTRFGERVITGIAGGDILTLHGESFAATITLGAGSTAEEVPGALYGAAFSSPAEGWLGMAGMPLHMTESPASSSVTPWPVPFRHPLLALAPAPGEPVGALTSEALAVGDRGAVARYTPGVGWLPESLFGPGERVEMPRLRAVAWPTPMRAFTVGDEGAMWMWRGETKLWEHDPAEPLNFRGDLLGIAFDPNDPQRGYAVGSNGIGLGGVLLRYGKSWIQETELPPEAQHAVFVGIAFAGSEAIVAYRAQPNPREQRFVGGLLVNDGAGWQVDQEATALMAGAQPEAVAGLPDGGAAFETTGGPEGPRVYERESATSPWAATPTPLPGQSAGSLTLFREGTALRAIVSGAGGVTNQSEAQAGPPGAPPPLPPVLEPVQGEESGSLLRQNSIGWSDETHELNLVGAPAGGYQQQDLPYRPDSVFAVLTNPTGSEGWAVGGFLEQEEMIETGNVERYPADGVAPLGEAQEPVCLDTEGSEGARQSPAVSSCAAEAQQREAPKGAADVTFAFGGGAECAAPCAERARAGVGPLVWLSSAVKLASGIQGLQAFIYTGPSVTAGEVSGPRSLAIPFASEMQTDASILASGAPLPTYVAAAPQDLDARPEREGTEATYESVLFEDMFPQTVLQPPEIDSGCAATVGCEAGYYAFEASGVRVIVLDDSGDVDEAQLAWLQRELQESESQSKPAIVVGAADLNTQISSGDAQAQAVASVLVRDGASAYFFDSPNEDTHEPLTVGGESIETYGSGTLGYGNIFNEQLGNFHGASGILLGEVEVGRYDTSTHRAPVLARLIPVIGELAMEARDGTLLRRSQAAAFEGLARRPRAGSISGPGFPEQRVDPYIPIPSICDPECSTGLLPEYTFSSSDESIGQFVAPNTALGAHAVLQGPDGKPVPDPHSGLFCAYNPGTTIVTVTTGGRTASLPVTVQAGSVRQPCGTVPAKKHGVAQSQSAAAPTAPPQPEPTSAGPASAAPLLLPAPLAPAQPPAPAPAAPGIAPFVPLAALPAPLIPFVPPPVPTPARPTPPSGTSAVTSPIEVAEREEEQEEAPESVSNKAVAYRPSEQYPAPLYVLGVVVLAAFAGASIRRRPRRRREEELARATVHSARLEDRTRGRRMR